MGTRMKAIQTLYRAGRISLEGVKQAVVEKFITVAEYEIITKQNYEQPDVNTNG